MKTKTDPDPKVEEMDAEELLAYRLSEESDEWRSVGDLEERKKLWQEVVRAKHNPKRKRISISVPEPDLMRIKARALEEGIPYQTLINSILHKYAWRKE